MKLTIKSKIDDHVDSGKADKVLHEAMMLDLSSTGGGIKSKEALRAVSIGLRAKIIMR